VPPYELLDIIKTRTAKKSYDKISAYLNHQEFI